MIGHVRTIRPKPEFEPFEAILRYDTQSDADRERQVAAAKEKRDRKAAKAVADRQRVERELTIAASFGMQPVDYYRAKRSVRILSATSMERASLAAAWMKAHHAHLEAVAKAFRPIADRFAAAAWNAAIEAGLIKLEPGTIVKLPPGVEIRFEAAS